MILCDEERLRPEKSEVNRLLGDNTKLKRLTNWEQAYDFERGIKETIEWIKENVGRYNVEKYNV